MLDQRIKQETEKVFLIHWPTWFEHHLIRIFFICWASSKQELNRFPSSPDTLYMQGKYKTPVLLALYASHSYNSSQPSGTGEYHLQSVRRRLINHQYTGCPEKIESVLNCARRKLNESKKFQIKKYSKQGNFLTHWANVKTSVGPMDKTGNKKSILDSLAYLIEHHFNSNLFDLLSFLLTKVKTVSIFSGHPVTTFGSFQLTKVDSTY